jgi:hypothetical protein
LSDLSEGLIDGEWEEDFEEDFTAVARNTIYSKDVTNSLQEAVDNIRSIVVDSFIEEAILAAVMIKNIKGDGDGFLAEKANLIRDNLKIFSMGVKKDPAEFVISLASSIEDRTARQEYINNTILKLEAYQKAYASLE